MSVKTLLLGDSTLMKQIVGKLKMLDCDKDKADDVFSEALRDLLGMRGRGRED